MKQIVALIMIMILAAQVFGASSKNSKPRDLVTVERKVDKFDRIKVSGPIEVIVITGKEQKVLVTTDSKYLHTVETFTSHGELEVSMKGLLKLKNVSEICKVEIWVEEVKELSSAGLANVTFPEKVTVADFSITTQGVSKTNFADIEASGKVTVEVTGASHLDLNGNVSRAIIEGSGAGSISFTGNANAISLEISGACKTFITAESDKMDIEASGACKITLSGHTGDLRLEASGATSVKSEKFKADNRSVSFSGAAKISIVD